MEFISKNEYLSFMEQYNNAVLISKYLNSKGWSNNAISALLGNMESESTINPGIWQSLNEGNMSGGFGLVQWTPATNFTNWADSKGYSWTDGFAQLKWIDEETISFGQWISTPEYAMTFNYFKKATETPEYLASAFLKNFERAGVEVEEERQEQARKWFDLLDEMLETDVEIPEIPDSPSTPIKTKRKKFNFILFNKRRRNLL